MSSQTAPSFRRVWRRTDDFSTGTSKIQLTTEALPSSLPATSVLIKVHAVSLNYRDGNITHGGNPWPVIPHGIPCNDASGEVIAVGNDVKSLAVGDRVTPNVDTENITGRETGRSWLAADEDGVLADHIVFDEAVLSNLPLHLSSIEASTIPCAGVTAWSALKGVTIGQTVLVQGTGGVSLFALKLARAAGAQVILTSSSNDKLQDMQARFADPPLLTVNYTKTPKWHEEVLRMTDGRGVDIAVEVAGNASLVKSIKCTRRGGTVSLVGYMSADDAGGLAGLSPALIDRRVNLRGINAGSKHDLDDLCAAIAVLCLRFGDIVDKVFPFEKADEALEFVWQGKQVGLRFEVDKVLPFEKADKALDYVWQGKQVGKIVVQL